jgi:hypothetical protein
MNAPAGGECGRINSNFGNSFVEASSSEETNSLAGVAAIEPERLRAITIAGNGALAVQQLFLTLLLGSDAREQQLCAALCVSGRQVPNGASSAPISTMAIVARWKTPFHMVSAYHSIQFSL